MYIICIILIVTSTVETKHQFPTFILTVYTFFFSFSLFFHLYLMNRHKLEELGKIRIKSGAIRNINQFSIAKNFSSLFFATKITNKIRTISISDFLVTKIFASNPHLQISFTICLIRFWARFALFATLSYSHYGKIIIRFDSKKYKFKLLETQAYGK